jgi:hypothetical protein
MTRTIAQAIKMQPCSLSLRERAGVRVRVSTKLSVDWTPSPNPLPEGEGFSKAQEGLSLLCQA